jgi:hypothetical protein
MISALSKVIVPVDGQERARFGWWSLFEDPAGTRYALGRWP